MRETKADDQPRLPGYLQLSIHLENESIRLDRLLLRELRKLQPLVSRGQVEKLFEEGRVYLDSRSMSSNHTLDPGKYVVSVRGLILDELQNSAARPSLKGSFIPVIFEDESLLILNKPSGIPSLPLRSDETETAVGSALAHYPELPKSSVKPLEPGLLHRLDTGTSGLLVFAKTQASFQSYRELWKSGGVKKTYRALVKPPSVMKLSEKLPIMIETPLGHDPHSKKKMIALLHPGLKFRGKGLPALTRILSQRRINDEISDLEIQIETGVMHQIRCHLASLDLPILGDTLYRGESSTRLWLHAWKLEFTGSPGLRVEAPVPAGWSQN